MVQVIFFVETNLGHENSEINGEARSGDGVGGETTHDVHRIRAFEGEFGLVRRNTEVLDERR